MTKIALMRHAKAVKGAPDMVDFDRPLEQSGREDASKIGRRLAEFWGLPDFVICSGAKRTRETLAELPVPHDRIDFSDALFSSDGADYVAALRAAEGEFVMIVGHNPSIHEAALMLAGSGDASLREALTRGFTTGAVALLSVSGPLRELGPGHCILEAFLTPDDRPPA